MSMPEKLRKNLFVLAAGMVDAAGTGGGAYLKDTKLKGGETLDKVGTVGDVSQTLGEQFVAATEYVHKSKLPTKAGLIEYLRTSKMKVSWDVFTIGLQISKQAANLKGASQCIADVAESVLDSAEFGVSVASLTAAGITWPIAAIKGTQMMAQLYATSVSCGEVAAKGLKDFKKMTAQEIKALVRIQAVIASRVNDFVEKSFEVVSQEIDPGNFDFAVLPKQVYDELATGLLNGLILCALVEDPIESVKTAIAIKVSDADAMHIANAIILANHPDKLKNAASFSQKLQIEATSLANSYRKMNLPTAFLKVRETLRISTKPSKKSQK